MKDFAPKPAEEAPDLEEFRSTLEAANINPASFLATDYLNHVNEPVMLIGMIPDMPDCLDEVREWRPKSYAEHFRDSGFSQADLAIAAYDRAPAQFRKPFDRTVDHLNRLIAVDVERIDTALASGDAARLQSVCARAAADIRRLIDTAGAIINGAATTIHQAEIDAMFADRA